MSRRARADRVYREAAWEPATDNGDGTVQVTGRMPPGGRLGGVILTVHADGGLLQVIQSQNLPGTPMPAGPIALTPAIKEMVTGALAGRNPILVAYTDESGQPVVSFRGSTQAFSDDQLAIWVRNAEGSFIRSVAKNPKVALMYRNAETKATYTCQGRARVSGDAADRDRVYAAMAQVERDHDFARTGVALIIDLDTVQGYAGLGPAGPIDPVRMARG